MEKRKTEEHEYTGRPVKKVSKQAIRPQHISSLATHEEQNAEEENVISWDTEERTETIKK